MGRQGLTLLLLLLGLTGCQTVSEQQARHRLYLVEPDLIRSKQVRLGMSYETVSERLGRPAFRMQQRIHHQEWSSWTYATQTEDWRPPGDDDTGFWPADSQIDPPVVTRARLFLTFRNGRLVAIEDPIHRTNTVTSDLGPLDQDTVNRLRREIYGAAPKGRDRAK